MKLIKSKNSLILFSIFLVLQNYSCSLKNEAHFEISNSTNIEIKNLKIQPDKKTNNSIDIAPNSKVNFKTDMSGNGKVDGSYTISFNSINGNKILNFGYYTNGYPVESITRIDIQFDTIIIKPEFKKRY